MADRPILFCGEMIRASHAGHKTQTRRVIKLIPPYYFHADRLDRKENGIFAFGDMADPIGTCPTFAKCPYGVPGDRLWVKETWAVGTCADTLKPRELDPRTWLVDNGGLWYKIGLSEPQHPISTRGRWRSPLFMPKWVSRLWLLIKEIRVEQLQDINLEDTKAEGWPSNRELWPNINTEYKANAWFRMLWDSLNTKRGYPWASNAWVWVIAFDVEDDRTAL